MLHWQLRSVSAARPPAGTLTAREREVLNLLVEGKNTKVIALLLRISTKTVEKHRVNILQKMEVESVVTLVHLLMSAANRYSGRKIA